MGKGRAPCCDKTKVKRGQWSYDEDLKLISFINKYGHENWRSLPEQAGVTRDKSCRLQWINYLRPDVKRGNFSVEEEETITELHQSIEASMWSKIASKLPGRTDKVIKNAWYTHLKKRLISYTNLNPDEEVATKGSLNREETFKESFLNASMSFGGSNVLSILQDSFQQPENCLTPRAHQDSQEDEVDKWFNHLESELGL
ncbi:hypothetical protein DY000_02045537 [Brassica cretica]|uniref:Uncharacterized protein n=1 Tax=Brassica cretica TaxID=69181 RepID=A0ABQ7F394_BRACR|nr:hypothetical protein DY000_02045537 [Brassica cretica]